MELEVSAFLLSQLRAQYDEGTVERILAGYGAQRRTTLRVNRLKSTLQDVLAALGEAGLSPEHCKWNEEAMLLPPGQEERIAALALYEQGGIYLQNLSSMLPPILLDAQPGESILDMAAAPGGKTTQIASMTGNKTMITACEMNKGRAERLKFNVLRQGATRVTVMNTDARNLDDLFKFDRILLDAPCSGSGTVSPRSKGQFSDANLAKTSKAQSALLDKALKLLKPGHEMVYSTCSILQRENEQIVKKALSAGAELVPVDPAAFPGMPLLPTSLPGTICVCPDECYEGFFVAKLRRKEQPKGKKK